MFDRWRRRSRKSATKGLHGQRRRWGSGPATNQQIAFLEILIEGHPHRAIAIGLGKHRGKQVKLTRAQASGLITAMLAHDGRGLPRTGAGASK
ncbi:MAG: hypothetical protein F4Z31_07755 [Gemmatimonadetes bacterium]|nr:hypothetical protein [Gemmatimonadota bacterium]